MESLAEVCVEVSPFSGDNGMCADDPDVRTNINRVRRILYSLGSWKNTKSDLRIQSYGGTITLPAAYDFIIKSWSSVRREVLHNEWFEIVTEGFSDMCGNRCKPIRMEEPVITFRDFDMVYRGDRFFRVEAMWESENEAEDSQIKLHGYNKQGGRETVTRIYADAYDDVTDNPPNDVFFRSLYQVTKGVTQGRIRLYEYIPDTDKRICVSLLEKDDVNPTFTRYRATTCRSNTCSTMQFLVQAKKKYRPLVNESDPVDIHTEALIHGLQALNARKSQNDAGFNTKMQMAVLFLNRELGQEEPFSQDFIKAHPHFGQVTNLNDYY